MKTLQEARQQALSLLDNKWIKWVHERFKPAYTLADKIKNIELAKLSQGKHCCICLNINGCCFPESNMPTYPLHPKCHLKIIRINGIIPKAKCELIKFTDYIFNPNKNNGKKLLFELWGYDIIDSEWLTAEFIRQGNIKYKNSEFKLNKLNDYGQIINIVITLPRKDKIGTISFNSGWMVYPDGVVILTTPYGGKL